MPKQPPNEIRASVTPLTQQELEAFGGVLQEKGVEYQEEPFELRAGGLSHWYVDVRHAISYGRDLRTAGKLMLAKAHEGDWKFNVVAGMGIGGKALAIAVTAVGSEAGEKLYLCEANDDDSPGQRYGYGLHGTKISSDSEVLVVDDTGSTGDSLSILIGMIKKDGGNVVGALNMVDRSRGMVATRLADMNIAYHALYEFDESSAQIIPVAA